MGRCAAAFAAGVLAVLAVQHIVYFHLRRIYLRRFRREWIRRSRPVVEHQTGPEPSA